MTVCQINEIIVGNVSDWVNTCWKRFETKWICRRFVYKISTFL